MLWSLKKFKARGYFYLVRLKSNDRELKFKGFYNSKLYVSDYKKIPDFVNHKNKVKLIES